MRFEFINYLKSFIGSRYQWTGEGPYNVGFDCSGFIQEGLRAFGLAGKEDSSAQGIFDRVKAGPTGPKPDVGDLVFFGKSLSEITHIGVMINNWQYLEAGGGDSKTVDKGMVRIRPLKWRGDMVAWRTIFKE